MRGERPKVMRELTCELDDRTRLEYGTKLVKKLDAAARAKAAIKYHQKEAERLVAVLIEGSEIRSVECQEIPYYTEGIMKLCRLDTYETLSEREMTDEERNGNLFAGVDETKGPESETNPPENEAIAPKEAEQTAEGDQVDPETAAQAGADAAIEKQISEEEASPEPVAEVQPRRLKQGRRA